MAKPYQPYKLTNPPILEATFDIRVQARDNFDVADLATLPAVYQDELPKVQKLQLAKFTATLSANNPSSDITDEGLFGYKLFSESGNLQVQCRVDGFTLHMLNEYSDWETLRDLAWRHWQTYYKAARPKALIRVALRYNNRIPLATDNFDLDKVLTAGPRVPPELNLSLINFDHKTTIVDKQSGHTAHIMQFVERSSDTNQFAIRLDIDAFQVIDQTNPPDDLGPIFEGLRKLKNNLFFALLTDKAIRSFA